MFFMIMGQESTLRCNSAAEINFSLVYIRFLLFILMSFCLPRDLHAAGERFWGAVRVPLSVQAAVVGRVHGRGARRRPALVRDHRPLRQRPALRLLSIPG